MSLKVLDLFAGCGGLSYGLKNVGFDIQWANEYWEPAAKTFNKIHPKTKVDKEDANKYLNRLLDIDRTLPRNGEVDCIVGGPPCQGFCGINRYRKIDDDRNSLIETFYHIVRYLKPKFVVMENVTGILTLEKGVAIKRLISALENEGYNIKLWILQAGCFGVPQNRWRVFVVGAVKGIKLPHQPEPIHIFPRTTIIDIGKFKDYVVPPPLQNTLFKTYLDQVTIYDGIGDLPVINNGEKYVGKYTKSATTPYQKIMRRNSNEVVDHEVVKMGELNLERVKHIKTGPSSGWTDLPQHLKPNNLVRVGEKRYRHRFGRLYWEGRFNTILQAPHPYWGRVIHPEQNRLISIRESARAQGFPDKIHFQGTLREKYRQIGNAVPPPLGRILGWTIRQANGEKEIESEIESYRKSYKT